MVIRRRAIQVRSELRLYQRAAVAALVAAFALVPAVLLLVGQDYARVQVEAGAPMALSSCAELAQTGPPLEPGECARSRDSQRESNRLMAQLAAEVGPPGASSHMATGIASFVLGHASTMVGIAFLCAAASLVLGGEAEAGVAPLRDGGGLRRGASLVRAVALVCVWAIATTAAIVAAAVIDRVAGIEQVWTGGPDSRSSVGFLTGRVLGGTAVAIGVSTVLVLLRPHGRGRARMVGLGVVLVLTSTVLWGSGAPLFPPTNAPWAVQQFGSPQMSYIDRIPFGFELASHSRVVALVAMAVPIGCLAALARPTVRR